MEERRREREGAMEDWIRKGVIKIERGRDGGSKERTGQSEKKMCDKRARKCG